ncbi:hypothetical protein BB559_000541 [Furculomyces boomerangus]|uniref:Uncharacterized protein n=1 Tax=Furculomyces boomerangus TaxID=61424 RepID=A0A2T9Z4X1_9FUNG|nr:hypothetical protein BB559_000541 [Furculomyces boomerangus]
MTPNNSGNTNTPESSHLDADKHTASSRDEESSYLTENHSNMDTKNQKKKVAQQTNIPKPSNQTSDESIGLPSNSDSKTTPTKNKSPTKNNTYAERYKQMIASRSTRDVPIIKKPSSIFPQSQTSQPIPTLTNTPETDQTNSPEKIPEIIPKEPTPDTTGSTVEIPNSTDVLENHKDTENPVQPPTTTDFLENHDTTEIKEIPERSQPETNKYKKSTPSTKNISKTLPKLFSKPKSNANSLPTPSTTIKNNVSTNTEKVNKYKVFRVNQETPTPRQTFSASKYRHNNTTNPDIPKDKQINGDFSFEYLKRNKLYKNGSTASFDSKFTAKNLQKLTAPPGKNYSRTKKPPLSNETIPEDTQLKKINKKKSQLIESTITKDFFNSNLVNKLGLKSQKLALSTSSLVSKTIQLGHKTKGESNYTLIKDDDIDNKSFSFTSTDQDETETNPNTENHRKNPIKTEKHKVEKDLVKDLEKYMNSSLIFLPGNDKKMNSDSGQTNNTNFNMSSMGLKISNTNSLVK